MSNIKTVRDSIRDWFFSQVRIDSRDIDAPQELYAKGSTLSLPLPACTLAEYPVKDLLYEREGVNTVYGSGVFTYSLIYRYPGDLTFAQLPTERVELVSQFLMVQALLTLQGQNGIKAIHPAKEEYPVLTQRDGTTQNDWLVHAHLVLDVMFQLTDFALPGEFEPIDPPPTEDIAEVNEINLKIYRAKARQVLELNHLDNEIVLERNPT